MFKNLIKRFRGESDCCKKVETLTVENQQLKQKLAEKQEHINKTNAYWKKKYREATGKRE